MITIYTICTGKYTEFFTDFYNSAEKLFLNNHEKEYIVFTDGNIPTGRNIKKIFQQKLGWPYDTMMRFHMFNAAQPRGEYVYFFNANMLLVDNVGEEVIPDETNDYLVGVNHPGFLNKTCYDFPYERRSNSNFNIPFGYGTNYYQGCFNGGRTKEFMAMSQELADKIMDDLLNNIIPIWHDESALNWYYSQKSPLLMSSSYAYPESYNLDLPKKILQLDKSKLGGHQYLRS